MLPDHLHTPVRYHIVIIIITHTSSYELKQLHLDEQY